MRRSIFKDNRGLTLVEMLVSFAILSVVMVALFQFMTMMTKQYQTSNNEVIVQNEAQTLVQQLENFIIDADLGVERVITSTGCELYVMNSNGFCIITYVGTKDSVEVNELYYTDYTKVWESSTDITKDNAFATAQTYDNSESNWNLLAEYVSTFNVTDTSKTLTSTSNYVSIEITISKLSRSYTVNKNIYLRNQIVPTITVTPSTTGSADDTSTYTLTVTITGPANASGQIALTVYNANGSVGSYVSFTLDQEGTYTIDENFSCSDVTSYEYEWVSVNTAGCTSDNFTVEIVER